MNFVSIFIFVYMFNCYSGDNIWNKFATSKVYVNFKLVFENGYAWLDTNYYPGSTSIFESKMLCAKACSKNATCQSFNFYFDGIQYICELLADNFCSNITGKFTLQVQPNGAVYDKIPDGMNQTCLEQAFANASASEWCNIARPGCTGTWPICDVCVKSCIDCQELYNYTGRYSCILWPENTFTTPIFASCYNKATYIMSNWVDLSGTGAFWYRMPFQDVNRITRLNGYSVLQFYFQVDSPFTQYVGYYKYSSIDAYGTVTNLTYVTYTGCKNCADGLQLGQTVRASVPFVEVLDPNSSCGSFWLLKSSNPINCPGGGVADLLGPVTRGKNGVLTSTGISWSGATRVVINYADITLLVS